MLIFQTICPEGVAASPVLPKSSPTSNSNLSAPRLADAKPLTDNPGAKTTDNNATAAQSRPVSDPPQNFRDALRKKIEPKPVQQDQDKAEPNTQSVTSEGVPISNAAQLAVAQKMATGVALTKQVIIPQVNNSGQHQTEAKNPNILAELVASPQTREPLRVSAQALNSGAMKSGELSASAPKADSGLLLATGQGQPDVKATSLQLPDNMSLAANIQSGKTENVVTVQASDKAFAVTTQGSDEQNGEQLVTELPSPLTKTNDGHASTPLPDTKLPIPEASADQPQQKVWVEQGESGPIAEGLIEEEENTNRQEPDAVGQNLADTKSAQVSSALSLSTGKGQAKSASGDSLASKLNLTQSQASTVQVEQQSTSTTNNSPNPDFGQMLSPNSQVHVVEQSTISSQITKTLGDTSANDISANIASQVEEHIHTTLQNGDRQITIRLYPPELGRVFVSLQEQEDQIIGLLEVSKAQTRYEIEQALPEIIQHLQESGVEIKRLEVVLTDQHEQQAYKDQSLQDGLFQPHGSSQQDSHTDNTNSNSWLTNDDGYQNIAEPQVQVTDNSINMLV